MIILEVEYREGHLCSTRWHSYVICGFALPGWFDINLHSTIEKYHILGIFFCASLMFHSETYPEHWVYSLSSSDKGDLKTSLEFKLRTPWPCSQGNNYDKSI